MTMQRLRVHEVAAAVGVSSDTIRKYEANGVLEKAPRGLNGWRVYTPSDVERIRRTLFPIGSEETAT